MYCIQFEIRYGANNCVPNMHFALHLKECIKDFGSVYGFWCFSFEQYNGIIGNYHINNDSIEMQVMRKFVTSSNLLKFVSETSARSQLDTFNSDSLLYKIRNASNLNAYQLKFLCEKPLSVLKRVTLCHKDMSHIKDLLNKLHGEDAVKRVSLFVKRATRLQIANEIVTTHTYHASKSRNCYILGRYLGENFDVSSIVIRPALVENIYQVQVILLENNKEKSVSHWICECKWLRYLPFKDLYGFNSPTKIWNTETERYSIASFLPAKFITGRFACCREKVTHYDERNIRLSDKVNVIVPLPSKSIASI